LFSSQNNEDLDVGLVGPHHDGVPWTADRLEDVLRVAFQPPFGADWENLFAAIKREVVSGATMVVFPVDIPEISDAGTDVLQAIIANLIEAGVDARRE
jgi:hypothetical protein